MSGLSYTRKVEDTGSVERRQDSGIQRTINIESVHEPVLSQESQPGTHRSVHNIARETDHDNHSHQVSVFRTQRTGMHQILDKQ